MKELEYIIITNRVRITEVLKILRDIIPDDTDKLYIKNYTKIMKFLSIWESELFKTQSLKIKEK